MRYVKNYDISDADVIPLIFETYGGWSPGTLNSFRVISEAIAGYDNPQLAGTILRHFRARIAVALHNGQGQIVSHLNGMNKAPRVYSR